MISNASKWILYLGKTAFGRHHDYGLLKKEFDPCSQWFEGRSVLVDLGYLWAAVRSVPSEGLEKDYSITNVFIPIKKKAHDKLPAGADLLELKKCFNKRISQMRIAVEPHRHLAAFAAFVNEGRRHRPSDRADRRNRWNESIISQTIHLKSIPFIDQLTETCAALWNYKLTQPPLKPIVIWLMH
ncbi:MAG: hypothetical protein H7Z75_10070 [Ferruginibacter sp.]|nr:hypothetical protein [Cytophagales bacterium]